MDRKDYRNRGSNRERMIMVVSSAFVLAALTLTGLYSRKQSGDGQQEAYQIPFDYEQDYVKKKAEEIAKDNRNKYRSQNSISANTMDEKGESDAKEDSLSIGAAVEEKRVTSLEKPKELAKGNQLENDVVENGTENFEISQGAIEEDEVLQTDSTGVEIGVVEEALHFDETKQLLRPVVGDILLPYSMEQSVYFKTLDQYRYHPATLFTATEGTQVMACCQGRVSEIGYDPKVGNTITLDLGDGYLAVYGQVDHICFSVGSVVNEGEVIATVAKPTKYYNLEGCNLYFQLLKDGAPIDPKM